MAYPSDRVMTVDLGTWDASINGRSSQRTRVSITRILTHEMNHAIYGYQDNQTFDKVSKTDVIMEQLIKQLDTVTKIII